MSNLDQNKISAFRPVGSNFGWGGTKFSESGCPDLTYIYILHLVMQGEITHLLVVGTDIEGNLFNNAVNYEILRKNKAENHTE